MTSLTKRILGIGIAATLPFAAMAESTFTAAGSKTTSATLNFQVTIPAMIYLQVGAGASGGAAGALAASNAISGIHFNLLPQDVISQKPVAATTGSGDLGGGVVTARVVGNSGIVRLSAVTSGPIASNDTSNPDSIAWSEVTTDVTDFATPTPGFTQLAAPVLKNGSSNEVELNPGTGKIIQREAKWQYTFLNSRMLSAGTYGALTGGPNGKVTYTAALD